MNNSFDDADPIEILKSLMKEHRLKSVDLASLVGVSEGLVSDMLNYKKGLSKETIRILADRFKLNQEAFNRPYVLNGGVKTRSAVLGVNAVKDKSPGKRSGKTLYHLRAQKNSRNFTGK